MLTTSEIAELFDSGCCKGQGKALGVFKCFGAANSVIKKDARSTGFLGCASVAVSADGVSFGITSQVLWWLRRRIVIAYEIGVIRRRIIENRFDCTCENLSLDVLLGLPRSWADGSSVKLRVLSLAVSEYLNSHEVKNGIVRLSHADDPSSRYEAIKHGIAEDFHQLITWHTNDEQQDMLMGSNRLQRDGAMYAACANSQAITWASDGFITQ